MTDSVVSLQEFLDELRLIENELPSMLETVHETIDLDRVHVHFLGRQSGRFRLVSAWLGRLPQADKPRAGAELNRVKSAVESVLASKSGELATAPASARDDLTLPARHRWLGAKHPVTIVLEEIEAIFRELGFTVALGPEVEREWYNFGALNFPPNHPAMDLHDTLYLEDDVLLRTHTSPVQVRTLQAHTPPIRILAPGNVYRRDFFDASHAPMFTQLEGLAVDEGITFVDFKATLAHFADRFFGRTKTRFRPSYFPFTEPSAEMDVECRNCGGAGCVVCKSTGWMEIMGCGMVHPSVIEAAGHDSERYTGWAFGMGPGRVAMLRYGIPDIRILYDSDVRFLEQFAE
ncbi:MAG: phenylalanine--tRNA ligase subunit alpha [Gemmatimonadaceae bacterium]